MNPSLLLRPTEAPSKNNLKSSSGFAAPSDHDVNDVKENRCEPVHSYIPIESASFSPVLFCSVGAAGGEPPELTNEELKAAGEQIFNSKEVRRSWCRPQGRP